MATIDWMMMLALPRWTPIRDIPLLLHKVSDGVYTPAPGAYLLTGNFNSSYEPSEDGPLLGSILWTDSPNATKRYIDFDIEADSIEVASPSPPAPLLPSDISAPTYSGILASLDAKGANYSEANRYRIGRDGAFVWRNIQSGRTEYAFRSEQASKDEVPFAIRIIAK